MMKNSKLLFLTILLMVFLSACGGGRTPYPTASNTPEVATPALTETTLQAALPTTGDTSDPTGVASTVQPGAALPPAFDLTRNENNPVTDSRQIIRIFEALESVQDSQPFSPGWYLYLVTYNSSMQIYDYYHVIDTQGNYDLNVHFMLSPERNMLSHVEEIVDGIIYSTSRSYTDQREAYEGCCNIDGPYKDYFEDFAETFSQDLTNWGKPGSAQWGEWTYSGWFEEDEDGPLFVFKEVATNMKGAYGRDPDSEELRAIDMETTHTGISLVSGHKVWEIIDRTFVNGRKTQITYIVERDFCIDTDCFPLDALEFLQEKQVIDNNQ